MNRKVWMGALALAALATAAGCAQEKEPVGDEFTNLAGTEAPADSDGKADVFWSTAGWRIVGSLEYGQTSSLVSYTRNPRYRVFKFAGAAGDKVDVWVRSSNGGDAVAWVLNDSFQVQGYNDDAPGTLDSHVVTTLRGNTRPGIVTYYIVFRDYDLARASFRVSLAKQGCFYDGQNYSEGDSFPSTDGCNSCFCGANGSVGCTKRACISTCEYDGQTYDSGDSFPATDGCNTCNCGPGGVVGCTKIACATTCSYGGRTYDAGDSFPSTDGCNTCSCSTGGRVACTERACVNDWNKRYVGTPATCPLIRFVCEAGTQYFSDARGCGCQQPSDCPEWINCQPPRDCSAERTRCPLSQIAW